MVSSLNDTNAVNGGLLGGVKRGSAAKGNGNLTQFHERVACRTLLFTVWLILGLASQVSAGSSDAVRSAIDRAATHLFSIQQDGLWETDHGQASLQANGKDYGGLTAIAVYALLASGQPAQDPRLAKALTFLKELQTQSVYVLGVRAQLWGFLPKNEETKRFIARDDALLLQLMKSRGAARGLYYYPHTAADAYDHSISQFGVLGLWASQRNGAEVPADAWGLMQRAWSSHQSASGGWPYIVGSTAGTDGQDTLSMTCAGVASLLILDDAAQATDSAVSDPHLNRGLKWIGDNFSRLYADTGRESLARYYILYGLERIGVAGGFKYFGTSNWFDSGAQYLLSHQNQDGSWGDPNDMWSQNTDNVPDTCFGTLFLAYGRARVVINKLNYASGSDADTWNERPRDIANLTRWAGEQLEVPLNWHSIPLSAPLKEWHDAPILYISGSQAVRFSQKDEQKLKEFVEQGGMILANADRANAAFSQSIKTLAAELFPSYKLGDLPADSTIFKDEQFPRDKFHSKPAVLGVSNRLRELLLLIPDQDASRAWQFVRTQNDLLPLGADVIEYATDKKDLDVQPENYFPDRDDAVSATGTLSVARIKYDGNWDPEPGGWVRLPILLHNQFKLDVTTQAVMLGEGQLMPSTAKAEPPTPQALRKQAMKLISSSEMQATDGDQTKIEALITSKVEQLQKEQQQAAPKVSLKFPVADLTGTEAVPWTAVQMKELHDYVDAGGLLIIDAAGGSDAFSESALALLTELFGAESVHQMNEQRLAPNDPLYTLSSTPIENFAYRSFAQSRVGKLKSPRVMGFSENNRRVCYFSQEDLSEGLVGEEVDGIYGYTPETATAIMRNMLLSRAASTR